jgi:2-octaprenyl-6-methoxyphenol hydroxylase
MADEHYDLIIIGGGLAGASLACALKNTELQRPLKIAVVEAYALDTDAQPSYDDRTVALSYGSSCIFQNMDSSLNKSDGQGLWGLLAEDAQAIDTIHISDRGHFGVTQLTKEQEGVEALGYVLENRAIGKQLYAELAHVTEEDGARITLFCPAILTGLHQDDQQVIIDISVEGADGQKSRQICGNMLVAADGNNSKVMKLLNIGSNRKSYDQVALITNVTPGKKHNNVAYERFTDSGPLAFLPMTQNRCSVVWTLSPEQADYLYALDEADFVASLQQRFGFRLGQIKKAGSRHIYPLFLQSASQIVHGRVALIGNAAHSVHPVAGQGFNLALRDIALLAELLVDHCREASDADAGLAELENVQILLQQYAELREQDIKRVYRFTDTLVKTFSNALAPLAHLRSASLFLVDVIPDIKHRLATQSMGLDMGRGGRLTRLNRGLRL